GWKEYQAKGNNQGGAGWIVGVKEAVFHCDAIPLNSRIITEAERGFQVELYTEIAGTARMGDQILAEIKLQVVQSDTAE
ncbi:MAG: hypothetical protein HN366_12710, partial [Deltaproteobacteria bacterium]|nr:hypothetical protein [Deltaproteobacteria bacterium]